MGLYYPQYSSQFIPDPGSAFTVGQVVQCRVLECDPVNKRLSLTLKVFYKCVILINVSIFYSQG